MFTIKIVQTFSNEYACIRKNELQKRPFWPSNLLGAATLENREVSRLPYCSDAKEKP